MAAIKAHNKLFLIFMIAMLIAFIKGSQATKHIVGDLNGWYLVPESDYKGWDFNHMDVDGWNTFTEELYRDWAGSNNFHVGDTLQFEYDNRYENVKRVTSEDFARCNPTSPIETYATGSDEVVLDRVGHHYFISGYPDHCHAGLRVDVFVDPASYPIPPASSPSS